jgi:NitT/TauT family transport system substrate-binding protein
LFADHGLNADKDCQLIELKPPEMVTALATGQIDAFIVAEPFGAQAQLQNVGKVLALSKEIWPEHICCVLNVRESVLSEQKESVQEIVDAFIEAGHFVEGHESEAAELSTQYLGQKKEVIDYVLTHPKGRVSYADLVPKTQDFVDTQRLLVEYGIAPGGLNLADYVDDSFAKRASAAP